MNQRLQELTRQAGFYANLDVEKFEKFAELIVRECADIAKHQVMNISTYSDAEFVDTQIKLHFGVEE